MLRICLLLLGLMGYAAAAPVDRGPVPTLGDELGGGNLVVNEAGRRLQPVFDALHGVGVRLARMNTYEWRTTEGRPTPSNLDAAMLQAWDNKITPTLLLEYYGSYRNQKPSQPVRGYGDWFAVGAALAERFRPNGRWAVEHGVRNWGVTVFAAMNEPDVETLIPKPAYHDALAGLADGVHSIDPALKVMPGGFATCNSSGDATVRGYGPAIADLLNDGKLDGIDLHTYYHERWFPLEKGRQFSAQACFDAVKRASGVTRDIHFYATEMNIAKVAVNGAAMSDTQAASVFLTGLWDHLGAVGNDRHSPVAALVFPWNFADLATGPDTSYAMTQQRQPWSGDSRADIVRTVLELASGMRVERADLVRGEIWLRGEGHRLVVWQDREGWTDKPGDSFVLDIPAETQEVEVWGYDGMRRRVATTGQTSLTVSDLPGGQTYMFLIK